MMKHCDVCSLDLQSETAYQGHLGGKKHLKRERELQVAERSIFVSPLPKNISEHDLLTFFHKFGRIEWHRFGVNNLIIQFTDRGATEGLLNQYIWFRNTRLSIKKRIMPGEQKRCRFSNKDLAETEDPISYENIKNIFEKDTSFDSQLEEFLNTVQLTADEINTRYAPICTQLDTIFKAIFPKCVSYQFGSSFTGLGFKGCDLDIYMDIGEPVHEIENVPANSWTMNRILREVKKIMYRMNCVFSNICSIPKAKTPIIKFTHVPTNISCDISFKNSLGLYKSYLIKYCISFDDRLEPLMMLIKYWARNFKISGTGKISNYALVMLIIFYLQQTTIEIIPPLMELQKDCEPHIVNGWQVNFEKNAGLPPITNKQTIQQLLHGFFFFYGTFEFDSEIICLLDGESYMDLEFKKIERLPQCMDRYKAYLSQNENVVKLNTAKPMCVQDPIELSHNITAVTPLSIVDSFVKYCALGCEICALASNNDYKDLMATLFKKRVLDVFKLTISAKQQLTFDYPKDLKDDDICGKQFFLYTNWYIPIVNIVKEVLERVVKVDVQTLTADVTETKQQKIDLVSDVHTKNYQKIILHCRGNYPVWRNRHIEATKSSNLDVEALRSNKVLNILMKNEAANKVHIDFTCTCENKSNPLAVHLTLKDQNCGIGVFHECGRFSNRKIMEIINHRKDLQAIAALSNKKLI